MTDTAFKIFLRWYIILKGDSGLLYIWCIDGKQFFCIILCVLCDESQFFTPEQAEQLFMITVDLNIPVICYGLRADFSLKGFPGSTRLLELAHTIEEMKTICTCGRKAICNCRKVNGRFVFEGEQVAIDLENDVQYVSMCPQCYFKARRAFYAARKN